MNLLSFPNVLVLTLLLACTAVTNLRATITGTVAPNGAGGYTYSYHIANDGGEFPIVAWSLDLITTPDWDPYDTEIGGGVSVPTGWGAGAGIPITGVAAQDFYSFFADVDPGAELSGFEFDSGLTAGSVFYFEFGPSGEFTTGVTVAPVPDDGPWWWGNLAMIGVIFGLHRWRSYPNPLASTLPNGQTTNAF